MSNFLNYLCCLGREKEINWQKVDKIDQMDSQNPQGQLRTENTSTTGSVNRQIIKEKERQWSQDEEQMFLTLYEQHSGNLDLISGLMNRSKLELKQKYKKLTNQGSNKQRKMWNTEEDKILLELYEKYGPNWQNISFYLKDRSGKQVRDRYINILDPEINKGVWSIEEDQIIVQEFERIGPKWSRISQKLKGRPENMVKNRWYSHIRKKLENIKGTTNQECYMNNNFYQNVSQFNEQIDDIEFQETCSQMNNTIKVQEVKKEDMEVEEENNHIEGNQNMNFPHYNQNIDLQNQMNNQQFQMNNQNYSLNNIKLDRSDVLIDETSQIAQQMEIEQDIEKQQKYKNAQSLLKSSDNLNPQDQFCSLYPNNYVYIQPHLQ